MLSKKTKYGLHALLHLARRYDQGPMLIADLAEQERIPKKFLEAILLDLKKNGLLDSRKGKGGGYSLSRHPSDIKMGHIIRILDGPIAQVPCVSRSAYHKCDECQEESCCGIRLVMNDVRDAMTNILDKTSLEDVIGRVENQKLQWTHNYQI